MNDVQKKVIELISKQTKTGAEAITSETTLNDLGMASLDAIEMIFEVEEHFNIHLPNEDVDFAAGTVGQLIEAVERQLAQKSSG